MTELIGGVGLFLLGMHLMTGGLKLAAGDSLRVLLERWTASRRRGLLTGIALTALIQSSSAVTVAVVGFVNAGLLSLQRALWVILGTNIGTTTTGWIVALVGVKIDVAVIALPMVGVGMALELAAGANERRRGAGRAATGFGVFFLGIGFLQQGFGGLAPVFDAIDPASLNVGAIPAFVLIGIALTIVTQSSSAAMAITLTATAGASAPLILAAAAVIGVNIGTTSTAYFAALNGTPPAKRIAAAHIVFNLATGAIALLMLPLLVRVSDAIGDAIPGGGDAQTLAAFHTIFNITGVVLMWPFANRLTDFLSTRFVSLDERLGAPAHLDPSLTEIPAIALQGLVMETRRMLIMATDLTREHLARPEDSERRYLARQNALLRLGAASRAFIGSLAAQPLPPRVTAAIPDLVRAIQHIEEMVTLGAQLMSAKAITPPTLIAEEWNNLSDAANAAIRFDPTAPASRAELSRQLSAITLAYETIKTALLLESARGRLGVNSMEALLLRAQRTRRLCEASLKAQRRLGPWLSEAIVGTMQQSE